MTALTKERKLTCFYVLFHSEDNATKLSATDWREPTCIDSFQRLGVDWISSRRALLQDALASGRNVGDYFGHQGQLSGHLNPLGQRVVFQRIVGALDGEFESRYLGCHCEPDSFVAFPDPARVKTFYSTSKQCEHYGFDHAIGIDLTGGSCKLRWEPNGRCGSFHMRVVLPRGQTAPDAKNQVRITVRSAGKVAFQETIVSGAPPRDVDVRVSRGLGFDVAVDEVQVGAGVGRLLLGDVRFE
jgi:hypothetical protein